MIVPTLVQSHNGLSPRDDVGHGASGATSSRRITYGVCKRGERQINVTPSLFEQSFAQWPHTGDTDADQGRWHGWGAGKGMGEDQRRMREDERRMRERASGRKGLTALDILPATRGYHQWDSMRDHVRPVRQPEKYCALQISILTPLALPFASLAWEGFLSSVSL